MSSRQCELFHQRRSEVPLKRVSGAEPDIQLPGPLRIGMRRSAASVKWLRSALLLAGCVCGWAATAMADEEQPTTTNETVSAEVLLVIGAAGTEEYGKEFAAWAQQWRQIAERSEVPIVVVGEEEAEAADDREQIEQILDSRAMQESSPLWIVLIGHGTYTRGVAKFNLRGPDVSAEELAKWLQPLQRPVVIVNCASSSGPFINQLSSENRVIVTATRSGTEQNYARFGKYFAQAMASPDSDLDHDDEVSVHEAFLRASADVRNFYDAETRIATEHALIDDNADGKGTPATMFRGTRAIAKAKDGSALDGKQASRLTLAPAAQRLPFTEQELKERDELEKSLDQLRQRKPELDPSEYERRLEELLIPLARIYQAAEARQNNDS